MVQERIIPVMGISMADFSAMPPANSWAPLFTPTTHITVKMGDGNGKIVEAEILNTQDPDAKYYLIKNPFPSYQAGNHYLIIKNGKSMQAFPKPQLARDWAAKIGEHE